MGRPARRRPPIVASRLTAARIPASSSARRKTPSPCLPGFLLEDCPQQPPPEGGIGLERDGVGGVECGFRTPGIRGIST